MKLLWDEAETASYDSGFPFYDRVGKVQNVGRNEPLVGAVVRIFLRDYGEGIKKVRW